MDTGMSLKEQLKQTNKGLLAVLGIVIIIAVVYFSVT
jgi:hypothetical protein